uniref:Transcriptional coactivator Hfi1/Transcriptional adapter 1 n=1 Tax=Manihot esculenta TaxID=3983 RepID=A0A2C9UVG4_MANES
MLGYLRDQKYVDLLTKFLSLKVNKSDFDRLCTGTVGRENVLLHNLLLRSIIKEAQFFKTLPTKESKAKGDLSGKVPNSDFLQSPCTGRSILSACKFRDHHSTLGPHEKSHTTAFEDSVPKNQEQSTTELLSMCSRPPCSVEDGEEDDQAAGSPNICSRSPIRAPLVLYNDLASSYYMGTCQKSGELPDSNSSRKRLEHKLEMEGIKVSVDCANLLNNSLDVYLKGLMNPCIGLAGGKRAGQGQIQSVSGLKGVWPLAVELNPQTLEEEWPTQLEKVLFHASEE